MNHCECWTVAISKVDDLTAPLFFLVNNNDAEMPMPKGRSVKGRGTHYAHGSATFCLVRLSKERDSTILHPKTSSSKECILDVTREARDVNFHLFTMK